LTPFEANSDFGVMMRLQAVSLLATIILYSGQGVNAATNLTSLVNLFIGTASGANGGSGGNAFPGTSL
jgi:p-aminobenzoyl-glutamate transporter AbgT